MLEDAFDTAAGLRHVVGDVPDALVQFLGRGGHGVDHRRGFAGDRGGGRRHAVGFVDRGHDAAQLAVDGLAQFVVAAAAADHVGHVGGELDDLHDRTGVVEDGVVIGLDEDLAAALAEAAELTRLEAAPAQLIPEVTVFGRRRIGRIAELGVRLALDFAERVAHGVEEVAVGGQDVAGGREFDHRLGAADGVDLAGEVDLALLGFGNVGGELDHLDDLARAVLDRIIGRLKPHHPAALAEALEGGRLEGPIGQVLPEAAVIFAGGLVGGAEQAVVPAADLVEAIARQGQEVGIGGQYGAGRREFDDRLRGTEGSHDGAPVGRGF